FYLYRQAVGTGCRILPGAGEEFDCTAGDTVYAASWPHYHELVHTVARNWGRPPAFLVEGLAEGLGGKYPALRPRQRPPAALELDSVAFYASNTALNYAVAGDFANYLLQRFGASAYRKLSSSLLYLDDAITVHRVFADVLGMQLDDVIAAWRQAPPIS